MKQILITEKTKNGAWNNTPIESRMYEDNYCYLFGEVNDAQAYSLIQQFQYLEAKDPKKDINLFINSPGGSVTAGLAIYDVMKSIKNDVRTICVGLAASMGSFLLAGGTHGKRLIYPHAEVLIHQPLGGTSISQQSDVEIMADHLKNTKNILNEELAKNCAQSVEKIKNDTDRDYWMSATEAIEYGIVDEIHSQE